MLPPHIDTHLQYNNVEALNRTSNTALKVHSNVEHEYKAASNGSDIPEESP